MKAQLDGRIIFVNDISTEMIVECESNKNLVRVNIIGDFEPWLPDNDNLAGMKVSIVGTAYFRDGDVVVKPDKISVYRTSDASPRDPSAIGRIYEKK